MEKELEKREICKFCGGIAVPLRIYSQLVVKWWLWKESGGGGARGIGGNRASDDYCFVVYIIFCEIDNFGYII